MWFEQEIDVIPAVDVLGEGAVRLERGDYDAVVERAGEPVALAQRWVAAGAKRIHLVDLDGARSGQVRPELVRAIAELGVPVQASGGIRSLEDAHALLDAGADRVVVGTAAWPDPTPWFELGEALVLALDVRDGEVRTPGWTVGSGIRFDEALALVTGRRMLVTAIDRDGTLAGPDLELVRQAVEAGGRGLAAGRLRSGGARAALPDARPQAPVVGRAPLTPR